MIVFHTAQQPVPSTLLAVGRRAHVVLALALALPAALWAQLPALPLEQGNSWEYDYVLGAARVPGALRISVCARVMVQPLLVDTVFSDKAGWNSLFGGPGAPYLKLAIEGNLPLFGPRSPDTLLVRADDQGNVWIRGFTFRGHDATVVKAVEQLWLRPDAGPPYHRILETAESHVDGTESMAYWGQAKWLGESADGASEQAIYYSQRFPAEPVNAAVSSFPSEVVAHARRFLPDLSPSSPHRLLRFEGESVTTAECSFTFYSLTGIGLVWIPIWSDQTELQGRYYELARASVGGRTLDATTPTPVRQRSWAEIKQDREWAHSQEGRGGMVGPATRKPHPPSRLQL